MLEPAMIMTSASGMSLQGFGARSTPKTSLYAVPAETMHNRPL